ncbi:MAG TPA: amidohydrolase [Longimicrobiales bacterium]|nr:amidohydrolase [Longimicrobiales bacterium]
MNPDPPRAVLLRVQRILAPRPVPGEAVLFRDGRVAAIGALGDLRAAAPDAEVIDLPGCTLTPGLTDAHVHLIEWALSLRRAALGHARSAAEAAALAAAHAAAHAAPAPALSASAGWVLGGGWEPGAWPDRPHRRLLDDLLPGRPVLLRSHDLHSVWASGEALRRAGIDAGTADPPGGSIERGPDGAPTGLLRENAQQLVLSAAPAPTEGDRRAAALEAQSALHRLGITGVHSVEPDSLGVFEALRAAGGLRLRILQALPLAALDDALRLGLRSGFGGEWIRIGGIKMFLDGALGSLTALLREPYEGSDDRGVSTLDPAAFRDAVRRGSSGGLAMTVHAIGDAAVDLALDVLPEEGRALDGPVPHRIEHVQLVAPDRLGAAGAAGIVCSVQPSHLMTDWRAADRHWGARARTAYAFRSLAAGGATLAFGSDMPVEPPDPRSGLYAAVTRTDLAGEPAGGWFPQERVSPAAALDAYTVGAARAAGDPGQGRLRPGSFADAVAWDRDPLAVAPESLLELRCMLTVVGGHVVWREQG